MGRIIFTPCCIAAITDDDGYAILRLRIPGTFGGLIFDPGAPIAGRFLKGAEIWCANGELDGDRAYGLRLEDDQGILAAIDDPLHPGHKVSERFSAYPTILSFNDNDAIDPALPGHFVRPGDHMDVMPIDRSQSDFIPAGFSLVGEFQSAADSSKSGRTVRCNFTFGSWNPLG